MFSSRLETRTALRSRCPRAALPRHRLPTSWGEPISLPVVSGLRGRASLMRAVGITTPRCRAPWVCSSPRAGPREFQISFYFTLTSHPARRPRLPSCPRRAQRPRPSRPVRPRRRAIEAFRRHAHLPPASSPRFLCARPAAAVDVWRASAAARPVPALRACSHPTGLIPPPAARYRHIRPPGREAAFASGNGGPGIYVSRTMGGVYPTISLPAVGDDLPPLG